MIAMDSPRAISKRGGWDRLRGWHVGLATVLLGLPVLVLNADRLAAAESASAPFKMAQAGTAPAANQPQRSQRRQQRPAEQNSSAGEAGLRQRVEQLEEQLVDIQVVLGTLQSLAQGQRSAPASFGGRAAGVSPMGAGDGARMDVLETQIRALSQQIERLQNDVRAMGGRRSEAPPAAYDPGPAPAPGMRGSVMAGSFGTTRIVPAERDPIGGLLLGTPAGDGRTAVSTPPVRTSLPADLSPKDAYETAYGYLLQQNYGAAEVAFSEFLSRYDSHALAGNAQYWLGETYFVRGDYKSAATAFLKGYQTYANSQKAPDSLLKLAVSLERLGERESACGTLAELDARFPRAPQHVRDKVQAERRRASC